MQSHEPDKSIDIVFYLIPPLLGKLTPPSISSRLIITVQGLLWKMGCDGKSCNFDGIHFILG